MMEIKESVALVTGANRGIGRAFVRALVDHGAAKVYSGARHPATVADQDVTRSSWTSPALRTSPRPPRPLMMSPL
jgi:NAD(P)-dependent dehydrogenase (short-subunit alcohol dehydrogenase family)